MATRIGVPDGDQPRIIVDCTHTFHTGARTGIQRVVRHFANELLRIAPAHGVRVVPARAEGGALLELPVADGEVAFPQSRSARESVGAPRAGAGLRALGHRANFVRSRRLARWLEAGPNENGLERTFASTVPANAGLALGPRDVLLSLDSSWVYDIRTVMDRAGRAGATRMAMLCDVLPVTDPQWFTQGTVSHFRGWLEALLPRVEHLLTISHATGEELAAAVGDRRLRAARMPPWTAVHLGADLEASGDEAVRPALRHALSPGSPPALVTVGTLEPRKNVDYAIDLFEALRAEGVEVQWHIVGAEGWLAGQTAARLREHEARGDGLRWWTDLTDGELGWLYRRAAALVAVSKAEGFGLPLVEARHHGLPVIASDIPVFREVLGAEGRYVPLDRAPLAAAIVGDFLRGVLPVPPRTVPSQAAQPWSARAQQLMAAVLRATSAR